MTQEEVLKLYSIIKTDDLASFCTLAKDTNVLKLSFGRFPILSVCYLYNSKKIIEKFGKQLSAISEFDCVYEPFALYNDFKAKSGKSIRLYATKSIFIMPIEMQAILHKDGFVKRNLKRFAKSENTYELLERIYQLNDQLFTVKDDKVKISAKKLSPRQKRGLILVSSVVFAVIFLFGSIFGIIAGTIGLGTPSSPRKITDARGFASLASSGKTATLMNDLNIENEILLGNFSGTINGNNKTITISYPYNQCLINKFSGTIKNLNIVYKNLNLDLNESLSLLAKTNDGEIENVNIDCNAQITFNASNSENYFCGFAVTNNNYIHNSSAKLEVVATAVSDGEACVAGFAGKNYGTISACEILIGSKIECQNVDVAGIVSQNHAGAEISTSENQAELSQTTNLSTWSPNVAGIALSNAGTISNCFNYGNLSATSTTETTNNSAVLIAGIAASNTANINHCKNIGDITVSSQNMSIYAGGITAYTTSQTNADSPTINFCGTQGNLNLTKESDKVFLYCGGISGFMTGTVTNCYSLSTFENAYNQDELNMTALMVGASYGQAFFGNTNVYLDIQDVYCLASEKTEKTLAIVYTNMGYSFVETLNADIEICATEEQIKQSSAYWE